MAKLENELSWSVSREQTFRDCQRAYYYQYYASWGGWEADAPEQTRRIYLLKNIKTLPMWAGSIVHETIAEALNRYARKGAPIKVGELQARARQKLRSGWTEAVNRDWLKQPKLNNLHELYYGNGTSLPKDQTERIKERVYSCLAAFAEAEILREILAVPYMNWKPVDQLDSFSLDGLKVWCALDFAYVDPSGVTRILDWKTGSERKASLKIQLACYAMYAAEQWFTPIEQVQLFGVFLSEGARVSPYRASPEIIIEAKDLILTSAAAMREKLADVHSNTPLPEDKFPCCEDDRVCGRCNYREVCPRIIDSAGSKA